MSGLFSSRKTTTTQDPMLTGDQSQLQDWLTQLASTGTAGGLNLGQAYTGSLGDFSQTGAQQQSSNGLMSLLQSAQPAGYETARNTLTGLATNKFNPDDPSSGYAAYSRAIARSGGLANDALNREGAITGDRFSTSINQSKANLGAQINDQLGTQLGSLYNAAQDRSLNAANSLGNLETQVGNNTRSNLAMGFDPSQGGLQNTLNNAQAQAQYSEFMRQRNEQLQRIGIGQGVFNKTVPFGQMSTTTEAPSIFSSMYGQIDPLVGSYNTAKYGAANAPNQSSLADLTKLAMALIGK